VDFFQHQDRARRNSVFLIVYFLLTVVCIVAAVYFTFAGILSYLSQTTEHPHAVLEWNPLLLLSVVGGVLLLIATGSIYKIWMLGSGGEHVAVSLGGVKVPANTRALEERILLNVVEEMALASGTPVPPVYLLENEIGINAFAAGTTPQNAVIGITRGAINTLSRDELQGVIAHEFSHILNGDMKLNLRLIGLLHGILVIALLGYFLMRLLSELSYHGSRRNSDDNKGAIGILMGLALVGAALAVIGYIGVFFANWIKAAVSRQREFLADASAVQFTRNPSGIADALKKIGGWPTHSSLKTARALEASHMFFGSSVMSLMFATHPPLLTRVQRIDPRFSGPFSETKTIVHSDSELVDPRSLSMQRASFAASHQSALSGADALESKPVAVVEQIGEPTTEHIEHVHGLVDQLERTLSEDVRDPLGAVAVIYALLLAPSTDATVRSAQMNQLESTCDRRALAELKRVLPSVDRLVLEQRLPVVCLALPALHQMSPAQVNAFRLTVRKLIQADRKWSLFEFAVHRFIQKRLVDRLSSPVVSASDAPGPRDIPKAFQIVLSALAHAGGNNSDPRKAFQQACKRSGKIAASIELLPLEMCSLKELDKALNQLENVPPGWKRQMLESFAECIAADGHVTLGETDLFRIISDALGCPMPPIIAKK
jgi:Zn-dependent protease with chaperone function